MSQTSILTTGVRNARNVLRYFYGSGSIAELSGILIDHRSRKAKPVVFFIDHFFKHHGLPKTMDAILPDDIVIYIDTTNEPKTALINQLRDLVLTETNHLPSAIVGMGGGITMDVAKAVSNLLTNGGDAEDYQGWDLVKLPGIFKVAVPTISGTGAEATRTCVMTNPNNGLKLGMNSDFTVYDQIILDPDLTATVPRNQYFHTGMDSYIHCIESLSGYYRNAIGDAYSDQAIKLAREVFLSDDMMTDENRARLMVASYLGGCAIATSYVGLVHPFSAGLSVVLGLHHCVANCVVMRAMKPYYPDAYEEFWRMVEKQNVDIPEGVARDLTDAQYKQLYTSTLIHEKPLTNALGGDYRKILTPERVKSIFEAM